MKHGHDVTKAQRMLGWTPRPIEETVIDTATYVLDNNLV